MAIFMVPPAAGRRHEPNSPLPFPQLPSVYTSVTVFMLAKLAGMLPVGPAAAS